MTPFFLKPRMISTAPLLATCAICTCAPVYSAIRQSRATAICFCYCRYTGHSDTCGNSTFMHVAFMSQFRFDSMGNQNFIKAPIYLAASVNRRGLLTKCPSSENAIAPFSDISIISASSLPSSPLLIAPITSTLT